MANRKGPQSPHDFDGAGSNGDEFGWASTPRYSILTGHPALIVQLPRIGRESEDPVRMGDEALAELVKRNAQDLRPYIEAVARLKYEEDSPHVLETKTGRFLHFEIHAPAMNGRAPRLATMKVRHWERGENRGLRDIVVLYIFQDGSAPSGGDASPGSPGDGGKVVPARRRRVTGAHAPTLRDTGTGPRLVPVEPRPIRIIVPQWAVQTGMAACAVTVVFGALWASVRTIPQEDVRAYAAAVLPSSTAARVHDGPPVVQRAATAPEAQAQQPTPVVLPDHATASTEGGAVAGQTPAATGEAAALPTSPAATAVSSVIVVNAAEDTASTVACPGGCKIIVETPVQAASTTSLTTTRLPPPAPAASATSRRGQPQSTAPLGSTDLFRRGEERQLPPGDGVTGPSGWR